MAGAPGVCHIERKCVHEKADRARRSPKGASSGPRYRPGQHHAGGTHRLGLDLSYCNAVFLGVICIYKYTRMQYSRDIAISIHDLVCACVRVLYLMSFSGEKGEGLLVGGCGLGFGCTCSNTRRNKFTIELTSNQAWGRESKAQRDCVMNQKSCSRFFNVVNCVVVGGCPLFLLG